jgi:hypothetical protein
MPTQNRVRDLHQGNGLYRLRILPMRWAPRGGPSMPAFEVDRARVRGRVGSVRRGGDEAGRFGDAARRSQRDRYLSAATDLNPMRVFGRPGRRDQTHPRPFWAHPRLVHGRSRYSPSADRRLARWAEPRLTARLQNRAGAVCAPDLGRELVFRVRRPSLEPAPDRAACPHSKGRATSASKLPVAPIRTLSIHMNMLTRVVGCRSCPRRCRAPRSRWRWR